MEPDKVFWGEIRRALMIALKAINAKYGFRDSLN